MRRSIVGVAAAALLLAGCGGGGSGGQASTQQSAAPKPATVTVLAASSLTEVFDKLKPEFEKANPGASLKFSYGGSSDLSQQIVNGAPADVFASANEKQMKVVSDAGDVSGTSQIFTTNVLTIVVPPGNPKGIKTFADLAKPDVKEVVCAPQVPCGSATQTLEKATNTKLSPVSEESDVKSVLSKVESGDADAGLVYVTDAKDAGSKVQQITFPETQKAINKYPIAVIKTSKQAKYAQAFMDFVLGPQGQQALAAAGFGKP
ncbi:MAG TPA: molybdate ABC transporter substrate-binding protein [Pseudonocardiaceae bacterium]